MGEGLTFENYVPRPGDPRELDPKWIKKNGYRTQVFSGTVNMGLSQEQQDYNAEQQRKREQYADGLHGYEYYSHPGDFGEANETEYKALKRRFMNSIPLDRWVVSDPVSAKSAYQDREDTFEKLRTLQPPKFMNAHVSAAAKKGMEKKNRNRIDDQLKDYKEMRANWEKTAAGKEWVKEVKRLKDMEDGKLVADPNEQIQISSPQSVRINASKIDGVEMRTGLAGEINTSRDLAEMQQNKTSILIGIEPRREMDQRAFSRLSSKYTGNGYKRDAFGGDLQNHDGTFRLQGTAGIRLLNNLTRSLGQGYDEAAIEKLFDDLMAPQEEGLAQKGKDEIDKANARFEKGVRGIKTIIFGHLRRLEATYGILPTQLKADDFMRMAPKEVYDHFVFLQDAAILMRDAAGLFDFAGNDQDKEFKRLFEYYEHSWNAIELFMQANMMYENDMEAGAPDSPAAMQLIRGYQQVRGALAERKDAEDLSGQIGGERLESHEMYKYNQILQNRYGGRDGQMVWHDGLSLFLM